MGRACGAALVHDSLPSVQLYCTPPGSGLHRVARVFSLQSLSDLISRAVVAALTGCGWPHFLLYNRMDPCPPHKRVYMRTIVCFIQAPSLGPDSCAGIRQDWICSLARQRPTPGSDGQTDTAGVPLGCWGRGSTEGRDRAWEVPQGSTGPYFLRCLLTCS
jgi:hypothetical protein